MGWRGYKFPQEAPEINPEALYDDPIALVEFREWKTRRKFIEIEKAKILRERVKKCYKEEGVNHQQNCQRHVLNYLESIKNIGNHVANSGEHDLSREQMKATMLDKRSAEIGLELD